MQSNRAILAKQRKVPGESKNSSLRNHSDSQRFSRG
jgi:hypothetical protein